MSEERQIQLEVLRYNPETDSQPRFQTYTVPCVNEWVVLDALNYVKENLDPTLSYRWSCHMAVCGSCGYMINGEPKLGCKAFIHEYGIKAQGRANSPAVPIIRRKKRRKRSCPVIVDDLCVGPFDSQYSGRHHTNRPLVRRHAVGRESPSNPRVPTG